jgi:hypothetical protein
MSQGNKSSATYIHSATSVLTCQDKQATVDHNTLLVEALRGVQDAACHKCAAHDQQQVADDAAQQSELHYTQQPAAAAAAAETAVKVG